MKRILILSLAITMAITGLVHAQSTDFTGTWVLDYAKSDLGSPAAGKMQARRIVLVIKQTANQLSIERSTGDRKETGFFKLDGSESINGSPGGEIKTWMKWNGSVLISNSTINAGDMVVMMNDVRSLSADGRVMTLQLSRQTPRGTMKQTLIYNKQ